MVAAPFILFKNVFKPLKFNNFPMNPLNFFKNNTITALLKIVFAKSLLISKVFILSITAFNPEPTLSIQPENIFLKFIASPIPVNILMNVFIPITHILIE